MATRPVLPDVEALAAAYLAADADVIAVVGEAVGTRLPAGEAATFPALVVRRVPGGTPSDSVPLHVGRARLQVDAWGDDADGLDDDAVAHDLAQTALAALLAMEGRKTYGPPVDQSAVITAVQIVSDPWPLPDPDTERARYLFEVLVTFHP